MSDVQRGPALSLVPMTLKAANDKVSEWHRHHKPTVGHKFSVGVADETGDIVGVAIMGRPVARMIDDGKTLEVLRVATLGAKNACSMLYGAAARAAKALGYQRIITYTLIEEPGTTLRAAGWVNEGEAGGGSWSRTSRPRDDKAPITVKQRWSRSLV